MQCPRHVIGSHFIRGTRLRVAFDDVASTMHESLAAGTLHVFRRVVCYATRGGGGGGGDGGGVGNVGGDARDTFVLPLRQVRRIEATMSGVTLTLVGPDRTGIARHEITCNL